MSLDSYRIVPDTLKNFNFLIDTKIVSWTLPVVIAESTNSYCPSRWISKIKYFYSPTRFSCPKPLLVYGFINTFKKVFNFPDKSLIITATTTTKWRKIQDVRKTTVKSFDT